MPSTVNGTEEMKTGPPYILLLSRRQMNLTGQSHLHAQSIIHLSIIYLLFSSGIVFTETEKTHQKPTPKAFIILFLKASF